ncbi:hypothetical protein [Clostridium perfringens]|uniref:hypothetical protein n=1 Tax=Clostridium perfringens TaxID=1502 RepID=UPI00352DC824
MKNACYLQGIDKNRKIIFHSDLGSQYTSNYMKDLCNKFNITQSFREKGYLMIMLVYSHFMLF